MAYFSAFAKARELLISPSKDILPMSSSIAATRISPHRTTSQSMSSSARTKVWLYGSTPKVHSHGSAAERVTSGRVTKGKAAKRKRESFWNIPIISTFFAQSDKGEESDLYGDTVLKSEESEMGSEGLDDTLVDEEMSEQMDANDCFLDYSDPRIRDWSLDEIWMFNKLSKRGLEPLLSKAWEWDFMSFPTALFTKNDNLIFINNLNTPTSYATNELYALIQAGPRCRDALLAKRHPEPPLKKGIQRYRRWSLRDGKLSRKPHLDLITVAMAKPGEPVQTVLDRVTAKLHSLGREWRNKWRHPTCKEGVGRQLYSREVPTVYGFVIKSSVVAIVTYDARLPTKPIRTLVTLDFKRVGHDVWHALAISIVCIKERDYLLQLDREGHVGEEIPDDSDPDA